MSDLTITFKVIGKGDSREVSSRYSGEIHTVADATVDVYFEDYDLAKFLQFVADVGVSS